MTDGQTVYVSTGRWPIYHRDPDCHHLNQSAKPPRPKQLAVLNGHYDECKACAGQYDNSGARSGRTNDNDPSDPPARRPDSNVTIGHVWTREGFKRV